MCKHQRTDEGGCYSLYVLVFVWCVFNSPESSFCFVWLDLFYSYDASHVFYRQEAGHMSTRTHLLWSHVIGINTAFNIVMLKHKSFTLTTCCCLRTTVLLDVLLPICKIIFIVVFLKTVQFPSLKNLMCLHVSIHFHYRKKVHLWIKSLHSVFICFLHNVATLIWGVDTRLFTVCLSKCWKLSCRSIKHVVLINLTFLNITYPSGYMVPASGIPSPEAPNTPGTWRCQNCCGN